MTMHATVIEERFNLADLINQGLSKSLFRIFVLAKYTVAQDHWLSNSISQVSNFIIRLLGTRKVLSSAAHAGAGADFQ